MLTVPQLAILKTELQTDPLTKGYVGKSHEEQAKLVNQQDRLVNRDTLDVGELLASIVKAEFAVLTAADKQYLSLITASTSTIPLTATVKTELLSLFGGTTATRANWVALQKRTGSRGEELGLPSVTTSDIADALRS